MLEIIALVFMLPLIVFATVLCYTLVYLFLKEWWTDWRHD